jgi:hypothetical protein
MTSQDERTPTRGAAVSGELTRRPLFAPLRVLLLVTGIAFLRGLLALIGRYCLWLRRRATLALEDGTLVLDVEWSILGRRFRHTTTRAPLRELGAVRYENRQRYLYLLVGFGALAVGTWVGIQWFVDGLRAGYPYLALVGAGIVALGVVIDLLLYLFVPEGAGSSRLVVVLGPWIHTLSGAETSDTERLLAAVSAGWKPRS